jgi:hypothetical protein
MASAPNIQDEMDRLEELNVFYAAVLRWPRFLRTENASEKCDVENG